MDYVDAAVVAGLKPLTILAREIVPNILPLVLVLLTLEMGIAVIVEAILSFVGLSISTDAPTWGGMIAEGRQVIHQAWWIMAFPMLALLATVLSLNLFGVGATRVSPVHPRQPAAVSCCAKGDPRVAPTPLAVVLPFGGPSRCGNFLGAGRNERCADHR
jgi:hypothetical protein